MIPIRRRLYQSLAGFSPRQLFAALQGAWLEPRSGSIWQENTGVTPTTTGGQTIGKIADLSGYGNVATQATASARPVLGRRYNLLTYSEDLSQSNWVKFNCTNTVNKIIPSASLAQHFTYQNVLTSGLQYTVSFIAKADGYSWLKIVSSTKYINIDTTNGLIGLSSGMSGTITPIGGGEYQCSVTYISAEPRSIINVGISDNASWDSDLYAGDGTSGIQLRNVDIRLTSGVGKDPAYQRITTATDYDYGRYPAAVFDANDFLSLSLPAINVRRNLLTYSGVFDNATAWPPTNATVTSGATDPNGGTKAYTLKATADSGKIQRNIAATASSIVNSVWIKRKTGTGNIQILKPDANYQTVTITSSWARYSVNSAPTSGQAYIAIRLATNGDEIDIYEAQLESGTTPTDVQKVTDWTSEAYSSSGSTYFATPVGMSSIHNQSISASYNIPALSSDIYGWVILPERLSAVNEAKLERYFLKLAGLAGPDYATDADGDILTADDGSLKLLAQ